MRPIAIWLLTIFLFMAGLVFAWAAAWTTFAVSPEPFSGAPFAYALISTQALGTAIGLWRMKRWALWFFSAFWLFGAAFATLSGVGVGLRSFAGLAVVGLICACYWRRLGPNKSFKPNPLRGSA